MVVKEKYLIEKRNVLNEIRSNSMNLQELRFFSIYLAKINARDISTRVVRFPIRDFQKIMDMSKLNLTQLQNTADNLLRQIVSVPLENGGFEKFQLFKKCCFDKDNNEEWYVEIDAHDNALPLMFEFKDKYFTYELWNALRLKGSNQLRIYELLKQYERVGERTILIDDLKELLGIKKSEYPRYNNFKTRVLYSSKEALETHTDIKFTYEPIRKKGKGGKVNAIKFIISRNENHIDQLSLFDFINIEETKIDNANHIDGMATEFKNERLEFLASACDNEFNEAEIKVLHNLVVEIIPHKVGDSIYDFHLKAHDHLKYRYDELNLRAERTEIKNRFTYFKKMLEAETIENKIHIRDKQTARQ